MSKENNTNKIANYRHYTNKELAKHVVNKTNEVIGGYNITEYIEPSVGSGSETQGVRGGKNR